MHALSKGLLYQWEPTSQTGGLHYGNRWEFYNIAKPVGRLFKKMAATAQHLSNRWGGPRVREKHFFFEEGGQCRFLFNPMPAPRKFLVASTSLPLSLGWGWNLSLYVGILLGLLTLMMLLLWMLLRQLKNSEGKSTLQPIRSFRPPHFEQRLQYMMWKMECLDMLLQIHVRNWLLKMICYGLNASIPSK